MLDRLTPRPGSRSPRKRVGRGPGSGWRKTSGRGIKGQGKRSPGNEVPAYFEGGQMPMVRRLPKRGFRSLSRVACSVVNTRDLAGFARGDTVDAEALVGRGLVRPGRPVVLLGDGDAPPGLVIKVQRASASARQKVEAAGGSVEIVP